MKEEETHEIMKVEIKEMKKQEDEKIKNKTKLSNM
jgi:hypothetical protein